MGLIVGDLVTRNSYNNDILFKIISIEDDVAVLKGIDLRLYADSLVSDLKKEKEVSSNDTQIIEDPFRFPVREMDPLLFITDKYAGGTEQNDFYMISDIGHIFSPQKPSDTYHYENIRIKQYYIQIISASNRQVN